MGDHEPKEPFRPEVWLGFTPWFWQVWLPDIDVDKADKDFYFHWLFIQIRVRW